MAHLSSIAMDFSATKQKAIEDAKKMQIVVAEECSKAGHEVPPYLLRELIGKGSFGRVYKASDAKSSRLVAVKIIDIEESDTLNPKLADTYSEFLKEINALKLLSEGGAKNINHVLDALPVGQSMWMVCEYCAGGSVATLMKPTAPGGLQEKWIIPILREVAEAIFWVHKAGIIHRDIKCANVLITEAGAVQLCDFGVSGVVETRFDKRSTFIGTPHWMAPELFDTSTSYGVEVDIWAFGSMVFEIASGLPPNVIAGVDVMQLGSYLKQHTPTLEGDKYSDQLKSLVSFCLVEDPTRRPIIEEVQHHPYLLNTETTHPTSSLAMLVRAFRVWESQGGSRKSLFALGGAQGPMDLGLASTAMAADEWNFSTTVDVDQRVMERTDTQAVYDVYGSQVDLSDIGEPILQRSKPKRRRPPPNLPVLRAPLEKIFDPNTISNYEENTRMYYSRPTIPPPLSDLPLRDNTQESRLRESLIDLDASLHGGRLSRFVDLETMKAGLRQSLDYSFGGDDFARPPSSDPETIFASDSRKTQEWKFPVMVPTSADPEMSRFPFYEDSGSNASSLAVPNRSPLPHYHTAEPLSLLYDSSDDSLTIPRTSSEMDKRVSMSSLIDLDESLPNPSIPPELRRPSIANSEATSEAGSAFDLDLHASYSPLPLSNREPSIYVSDDSDLAGGMFSQPTLPSFAEDFQRSQKMSTTDAFIDDAYLYTGPEATSNGSGNYTIQDLPVTGPRSSPYYHDSNFDAINGPEHTMMSSRRSPSTSSMHSLYQAADGRTMPLLPGPPTERVMLGEGGQVMKDEFLRLLDGMTSHLKFTGEFVQQLPVRKAGRNSIAGDMVDGVQSWQ